MSAPSVCWSPAYIETLGHLANYREGKRLGWRFGAVGAEQLKQMESLFLSRPDRSVQNDALIEHARLTRRANHRRPPGAPAYLLRGVRLLFVALGLEAALERRGNSWILHRRPELWRTDTDLLEYHFSQGQAARHAGDLTRALSCFQAAEALCVGPYLPDFEPCLEMGFSIEHEVLHWEGVQRNVRLELARLSLALPEYSLHERALAVLRRACDATPSREVFLLAAEAANRCANPQLAAYFRRSADEW